MNSTMIILLIFLSIILLLVIIYFLYLLLEGIIAKKYDELIKKQEYKKSDKKCPDGCEEGICKEKCIVV